MFRTQEARLTANTPRPFASLSERTLFFPPFFDKRKKREEIRKKSDKTQTHLTFEPVFGRSTVSVTNRCALCVCAVGLVWAPFLCRHNLHRRHIFTLMHPNRDGSCRWYHLEVECVYSIVGELVPVSVGLSPLPCNTHARRQASPKHGIFGALSDRPSSNIALSHRSHRTPTQHLLICLYLRHFHIQGIVVLSTDSRGCVNLRFVEKHLCVRGDGTTVAQGGWRRSALRKKAWWYIEAWPCPRP